MSSATQKRKLENESSESESESEHKSEETDEDSEEVQNIDVEFEAESPTESDFHGIKQLLLRALLLLHVDVSELTNIILAQEDIGSTAKIVDDDEDEVYGIFSVVGMNKHKNKPCIKELQKEILSKCKSHQNEEEYKKWKNIFNNRNVGYLVNERFINIPSQLAVPFHQSLCDEVEEAKKKDSNFKFDYLFLIAKTLKPTNISDLEKEKSSSSSKEKKKKKKEKSIEDVLEYTNFEDELYHKASELSCSFSVTQVTGLAVSGDWDFGDQPMNTLRTVMLVPVEKWKTILKSMKEMVED